MGGPERKLVALANAMIGGKVHLVEGCRALVRLRHRVAEADSPVFRPILGFDSDTDDYPLGDARRLYSDEYLQRADRELNDYINRAAPTVLAACREIAAKYGGAGE